MVYIPWFTETIKKRAVRYLLHHYLGQFFEEKLTLEQLSIDIYEGKGSIRDLALDVDGLNDELDFIPFKFLDGCMIGQISVEVPWSLLPTDACRVELEGAVFVCRLKTSVDGKAHCMESTIFNRSQMTTSMQMAEDIITHEDDDDDYQSPSSSFYNHPNRHNQSHNQQHKHEGKRNSNKDNNSKQMFEGLEMFAQFIDSVLRRTKLTARNTLFRIEPQRASPIIKDNDEEEVELGDEEENTNVTTDSESAVDEDNFIADKYSDQSEIEARVEELSSSQRLPTKDGDRSSRATESGSESPISDNSDLNEKRNLKKKPTIASSDETVEFLIKFFRCEEVIDIETGENDNVKATTTSTPMHQRDQQSKQQCATNKKQENHLNLDDLTSANLSAMPETVTKLLTLEDVEMRIGGVPVSNLVGKHTIMIKFNGQKSEISIFSGSPLLAVISHEQLKTFFNVFDSCAKDRSMETGDDSSVSRQGDDFHQQVMGPEDYAKIENQLLESVSLNKFQNHQKIQSQLNSGSGGRRWVGHDKQSASSDTHLGSSSIASKSILSGGYQQQQNQQFPMDNASQSQASSDFVEPSLDHIEAFSCQLKLPGIWLCLLLDGETIPPLIKPYADSICSFQTINKYIDKHIKAPHLRCLALKVSLDITPSGTNIFLGDLDISEHLKDPNFISPIIPILRNDATNSPPTNLPKTSTATATSSTSTLKPETTHTISSNLTHNYSSSSSSNSNTNHNHNYNSSNNSNPLASNVHQGERYKAKIVNNKDIVIESLTRTRLTLDPTLIDRLVFDYKLFYWHGSSKDERVGVEKIENNASIGHSDRIDVDNMLAKAKRKNDQFNFTVQLLGDHFKVELLCPIPDLTPEGLRQPTKIRPQSFLFEINGVKLNYENDKMTLSAQDGSFFVKTQPQQTDFEAVKFVEAKSDYANNIVLTLEPSPSKLEDELIDDPLNGSTMFDSIYVAAASESKIPTEAFATKRKLVRQSTEDNHTNQADKNVKNRQEQPVQTEKILTPGDREHLLNYLNQTVMSTKFSLNLHLPICNVQIEDKEQLDLIYNRFANDFVFWQPKICCKTRLDEPQSRKSSNSTTTTTTTNIHDNADAKHSSAGAKINRKISQASSGDYQDPINSDADSSSLESSNEVNLDSDQDQDDYDDEAEDKFLPLRSRKSSSHQLLRNDLAAGDQHSLRLTSNIGGGIGACSNIYANEVTCKILIDEISIVFNHQGCSAAQKQQITSDNLLLGCVIDVGGKPSTIVSMVADNLELFSDAERVLVSNNFSMFSGNEEVVSTFSLTTEIKRPTPGMKNIRLALQLNKALFNDFKLDTFKRFWQSINVTDEPILGYIAPKIVTELHVDILNTGLMLVRENMRPALLAADELYITSMVMDEASQPVAMLRIIAEEMSLYLKRSRKMVQPSDFLRNNNVKNFVCLIDSGVIDLDVKLSSSGRVEFGVINNVINLRACQDSLSALCNLVTVLLKSPDFKTSSSNQANHKPTDDSIDEDATETPTESDISVGCVASRAKPTKRELELLEAAMSELSADQQQQEPSSKSSRNPVVKSREHSRSSTPGPNQLLPTEDSSSDEDENEDAEDDDHEDEELDDDQEDDEYEEDDELNESDDSDDYATESEDEQEFDELREDAARKLLQQKQHQARQHVHKRQQEKPARGRAQNKHSCILDQSNPMLDDMVLPPLLMPSSPLLANEREQPLIKSADLRCDDEQQKPAASKLEESGFFVIGDDDVGAGILDTKRHREPVIRKLIDGPINIIDDYFKNTKPRTIPEILATSLERYLLEEMTLIVNLFGGQDFEDNDDDYPASAAAADELASGTSTDTGFPTNSSAAMPSSPLIDNSNSVALRAGSLGANQPPVATPFGARRHLESEPSPLRKRHQQQSSKAGYYPSGGDAVSLNADAKSVRFGEGAMNLWESLELSSSEMLSSFRQPNQFLMSPELKQAGGPLRQVDKSIQLYLSKIKCLYEAAAPTRELPISWRFKLLIQDIEIRDRLQASDINKMLYEYTNDQLPRRSVPQLTIRNVATINPTDLCEECDLRVSVKPLRLNVDQDTLLFLIDFFTQLTKSLQGQAAASAAAAAATSSHRQQQQAAPANCPRQQKSLGARAKQPSSSDAESSGLARTESTSSVSSDAHNRQQQPQSQRKFVAATKPAQSSQAAAAAARERVRQASESSTCTSETTMSGDQRQQQQHRVPIQVAKSGGGPTAASKQAIYVKSFTFSPDVPIRVDYHAKHMDLQQGALAGILMGLADLDRSELVIKALEAKHGMRGFDRVLLFALNHWLQDIKRNQVPSILSGIGPIHHVIDLFKGIRDLILMPIEQYRRDKRLVRGFQKGASSFSSSTAMAAISLMNRFISIIQCTAQIAHDIVTPPGMQQNSLLLAEHQLLAVNSGASSRQHYQHHHICNHSRSPSSRRQHSQQSRRRNSPKSSPHHHEHLGPPTTSASGPGDASSAGPNSGAHHAIGSLNQPRNFCEGVTVGFNIIREGLNDTARNVALGMQGEDMRSAVGGIVRQIPSTLLNPIISATEGAQNVLVGMRNQIAPDARREDQEKWKRRVKGRG